MDNSNKGHIKNIVNAGKELQQAEKALIMLHGRGSTAEDILSLADHLQVRDFALMAPQATNNTWYPYSFMALPEQNEPWLSSALGLLEDMLNELASAGIAAENTYFLGFSQGACLALEFVTRNAGRFGGVVAFSGGLIGDRIYPDNYAGDFKATPVLIAGSDPDPHVPVERVHASTSVLTEMNASVTEKVYKHMGHTISREEIDLANELIFAQSEGR